MKLLLTLMLFTAALLLTACTGSNVAGPLNRPDDTTLRLTDRQKRPCARPESFLGAGDWEIIAGRIGDALILCGAEKALVVDAYDGLLGITAPTGGAK
jgi:hypothetical protein